MGESGLLLIPDRKSIREIPDRKSIREIPSR